jgi:hypothetical protein
MAKQDVDSILGRLFIAQSKIADLIADFPELENQQARQVTLRALEEAVSNLLLYAKGDEEQRVLLSRAHNCLDLGDSLEELAKLEEWFPILVDIAACGFSLHRVNKGHVGIPADCEHMATIILQRFCKSEERS